MTLARRAQREILHNSDVHHPRDTKNLVDWEYVQFDGSRRYYYSDGSMIVYASGSRYPDVWTKAYQVKMLGKQLRQAKRMG